jgi:hypothetical protein
MNPELSRQTKPDSRVRRNYMQNIAHMFLLLTVTSSILVCSSDALPASKLSSDSVSQKKRAGHTSGKGFILKAIAAGEDWSYHLYQNRNYTGYPSAWSTNAMGVAGAKAILGTLASGEGVYWYPWQRNCPPDVVLIQLRDHCKKLDLRPTGFPSESKKDE